MARRNTKPNRPNRPGGAGNLKSALKSHKHHQGRKELIKKQQDAEKRRLESQASGGAAKKKPAQRPTPAVADAGNDAANAQKARPKTKGKERRTYPFESDDTILLIGEGNFSFTLSLLSPPHSHAGHLICATAYDSEEECYSKYPDAEVIVKKIKELGARVEFGVDGRDLEKGQGKKIMMRYRKSVGVERDVGLWSKIVFNFPHAGAGIKDQDRNVLTNQHLMLDFFRSASPLLTTGPSSFADFVAFDPTKNGLASKVKGKANANAERQKMKNKKKEDEDKEEEEEEEDVDLDLDLDEDVDFDGNYEDGEQEGGDVTMKGSEGASTQATKPATFQIPYKQGTILVTLKDSLPYTLWDLPHLATKPPLALHRTPSAEASGSEQPRYRLLRSFAFHPDLYEGYEHRRTIGWREGVSKRENEEILKDPRAGACRTWEFAVKPRDKTEEELEDEKRDGGWPTKGEKRKSLVLHTSET